MATATTSTGPLTATAPVSTAPDRLLSLDVLRGITMACMVLVNDPGSAAHYEPLEHADWNGATFTDMVFPCFLVIMGVAMTLSFASRLNRGASHRILALHALRRGATIVLIGLAINLVFGLSFAHLRLPGVLQRIGVCYSLAALLYLGLPGPDAGRWKRTREFWIAGVAFFLLALYWVLLRFYPTPGFGAGHMDTYRSLPAVVDRAVFTTHHIWRGGVTPGLGPTFDPEGLLSTLPAVTNVLFGILAGEQLRTKRSRQQQCGVLASMGTVLWLAGLLWSLWFPLNKKLWTSSFAMFTSGLSILCLAGLLYLVDMKKLRRGWGFFLIFGTNAILSYILSDVMVWVFSHIRFATAGSAKPVPLSAVIFRSLFAPWLSPNAASLGYALFYVCIIAALVYPFYRKRIFLRI